MRILIVEDDRVLGKNLRDLFEKDGYSVDIAEDGDVADSFVRLHVFSLIVLDLGLPNRDGVQLLKSWRTHRRLKTPVLILTARSSWHDKVLGLDEGADDYVVKPFDPPELLARARALVRRSLGIRSNTLDAGGLCFDVASKHVTLDGKSVDLTAKEKDLLHFLMLHQDKPVSHQQLLEHLYDAQTYVESNTLGVFIRRLRRKLGARRIATERGYGYRLVSQT